MDISVISTLTIMNKAVLNIHEQVFVFVQNKNSKVLVFHYFGNSAPMYLGAELLNPVVILHFRF